jgi:hypothetical protein
MAVFSGLTAAWLWGASMSHRVIRSRSLCRQVPEFRRELASGCGDWAQVRDWSATSIVRTTADLSRWLQLAEAVALGDAALHARRTSMAQLTGWADAHPGHPGVARLKRVLGHAERLAQSPMETRLRMVLVLGGLPRPKAQVKIYDSNGRFVGKPDLY